MLKTLLVKFKTLPKQGFYFIKKIFTVENIDFLKKLQVAMLLYVYEERIAYVSAHVNKNVCDLLQHRLAPA